MRGRSRSTSGSTKYLSTLAMAFAVVMGIACYSSCNKPDEPKPTPTPVNPVNPDPPTPPADKDTKAPTITLVTSSVGIYGGKVVTIEAGKLSIGETEVASWTDDKSDADKCTVALSFTEAGTKATAEAATDNDTDTKAETKAGTTIKSGDTLEKAGTLTLTVTDEANNSASKDITLTEDNSAPEVKVLKESVNVYGGKAVTSKDNTLSIGDEAVLQWTDDHGDECTLTLALDGVAVSIGSEVSKAGTLKVTVTDSKGLGTEASITLTDQIVFGMESLKNLDLQIDKEVSLLDGITAAEGWTIAKVEIETDGTCIEIPAPYKYTPAEIGTIRIIITITDGNKTAEFSSDELTVKPLEYNAVTPAKAESMYQKFNTTNDRAFERWGAYETKALAQSLKNRNACKVLIFREGAYIPGESDIHEWRGGSGDGHGEEIYRNITEGSGDVNNIYATRLTTWSDVKEQLNKPEFKGLPLIITSSESLFGTKNLNDLLNDIDYNSFKDLGNDKNLFISVASCNLGKDENCSLHESINNNSDFCSGVYGQESAMDTNNGIIGVEHGISKNVCKHGVYEGNHNTTSCAYISKDHHIIPRNVISLPKNKTRNDSEERTKNNTSFAAPAAAAMARNVYDICHPLGIVEHLQDTRFLMEKYATKVPSTREDIAEDGTIIEDVPNGYVYTMNLLALIDNEIFPAIEKKCTSVNGECTVLYTYDGLRLAYQGAGVEYQDNSGIWRDTNGINPEEYVDRPQRINYSLKKKYGNQGSITIYCMVPDGVLDYGDRKGGYIVKKENADIPTG